MVQFSQAAGSIYYLPFKRGDCSAIQEHVLTTLVLEPMWLGHVQSQYISRVDSHLILGNLIIHIIDDQIKHLNQPTKQRDEKKESELEPNPHVLQSKLTVP